MYKEILNILCCPDCKSPFTLKEVEVCGEEIVEGTLTCEHGHQYYIRNGIIDFYSNEQTVGNNWSEFYKEIDYESYDRKIEAMKSDKEKENQNQVLDFFMNKIKGTCNPTIVDIASGRGMLLQAIANNVHNNINLIATDLSFEVLMYDRLKLKKLNPDLHVNFIACDATKLPLKENCADIVTSFYGIANMLNLTEKGIADANRILKDNGVFLNSFMLIQKDTQGYVLMKQICEENDALGAENFYIDEVITETHKKYYDKVICNCLVEEIWEEENELDVLPCPGEWYSEVVFECKK